MDASHFGSDRLAPRMPLDIAHVGRHHLPLWALLALKAFEFVRPGSEKESAVVLRTVLQERDRSLDLCRAQSAELTQAVTRECAVEPPEAAGSAAPMLPMTCYEKAIAASLRACSASARAMAALSSRAPALGLPGPALE